MQMFAYQKHTFTNQLLHLNITRNVRILSTKFVVHKSSFIHSVIGSSMIKTLELKAL